MHRTSLTGLTLLVALSVSWAVPQTVPAPSAYGGSRLPVLDLGAAQSAAKLGQSAPARRSQAELVSVEQIWAQAPHNGFTDLMRFRGRWYCAMREGAARVSPDGAVRLLSSSDGATWFSAAHFAIEGADLRDPKLSITSDNRLMLSAAAVQRGEGASHYQTLAWYALDGRNWGMAFRIGDPDMWLWRVRWHRGSAYSMAYSTGEERYLRMYVGPAGLRFQTVAEKVFEKDTPTETELLFGTDDTALALMRRDGGNGTTFLGRSRPPYRGWQWDDLGVRLTGPVMLRLPDNRVVAAGGIEEGLPHTSICWLDAETATLSEVFRLPSGGDTGYPGLAFDEDMLWVTYHSSHEGQPAVYLAKIRLPAPKLGTVPR